MATNPCQQQLLRRLALLGSWAGRDQLGDGAGFPQQRVDDELAHLVASGAVLFNERAREWRLAGELLARRAAQRLLEAGPGVPMMVLSHPQKDGATTRLGLALYLDDGALVMAELVLPISTHDLAGQWALATTISGVLKAREAVAA